MNVLCEVTSPYHALAHGPAGCPYKGKQLAVNCVLFEGEGHPMKEEASWGQSPDVDSDGD